MLCPPELSARRTGGAADASGGDAREAAPQSCAERSGRRNGVRGQRLRRGDPALVGRQPLRQSLRPESRDAIGHRHRRRQRSSHRSRQGLRHPSHRARFRRDAVSGARRAVDRHHPARRRRRRPAASPAPIFGREPAQRRAARLQQRLAHREAGAGGSPGPPGPRRRSATISATSRSATRSR